MTMPRGRVLTPTVLAAIAMVLAGVEPARADQVDWIAPGDGLFQHSANWSLGIVPDANDLVVLDQPGATSTISFNGDVQTLSLELYRGDYTLDLNGHTYAFEDIAAPINLVGTDGYALTFIDGAVTSQSAAMYGTGVWTIGDGATVDLTIDLTMAGDFSDLYVDGGTLTAQSARIADGASSRADLWVIGGGRLSLTGTLRVGHVAGSGYGSVDVVGAGTRLEVADEIIVGSAVDADFRVKDFGEASAATATFGGGGNVSVRVLEGGALTIASEMSVGSGTEMEIDTLGVVDVGGIGTRLIGGTVAVGDGGTLRTTALERTGGALWLDPGSTVEITSQDVLIGPGGPFGTSLTIEEDGEVIVGQSATVSHPDVTNNITIVGGAMSVGGDLVIAEGDDGHGLVQLASVGGQASTLDVGGRLEIGDEDDSAGALGLYGDDDVTTALVIEVGSASTVDQQTGSILALILVSRGSFMQNGGLLAVGDDPPPEITSGVVVNHLDAEDGGGVLGFLGETVTGGARLAPGAGAYAYLAVDGPWTCNGAIEVGRPDGATEEALLDVADRVTAAGDVTLHPGAQLVLHTGVIDAAHVHNHGTVAGEGSFESDVTNHGRVDPISTTPSVETGDILIYGQYEQTGDGALAITIASATENDRLWLQSSAQLGGSLEIEHLDGYEPPIGEPYEIIVADDAINGTFDVEPVDYEVVYLSNRVIVTRIESCPADLDGTGAVGFTDLALLLGNWGPCDGDCPWDLDGSNHVGFSDLALLLGQWGSCPNGGGQ